MSHAQERPAISDRLRNAGLRPTRQREALACLLFKDEDRHVTAEELHNQALAAGSRVALATVYNTLHQFVAAGLLREIVIDAGRSYFDTNIADHHHFYFERTGRLEDIPAPQVVIARIPEPPAGCAVKRVEVVVRVEG